MYSILNAIQNSVYERYFDIELNLLKLLNKFLEERNLKNYKFEEKGKSKKKQPLRNKIRDFKQLMENQLNGKLSDFDDDDEYDFKFGDESSDEEEEEKMQLPEELKNEITKILKNL